MKRTRKTPLKGHEINAVCDRAAMGLPDHHIIATAEFLEPTYRSLIDVTPELLVDIVTDIKSPVARRFAAGTLLGLVGDPRVNTFSPPLVSFAGGNVNIGLSPDDVDSVMRDFGDTGILRDWIAKETPRHKIELPPFRLGKFPVTNQEYRDFLNSSGYSEIPTSWEFGRMPEHAANRPVYTVSAAAADAYARWLAAETGRPYRLPTEAEWEYAAAGTEGRIFPWGDNFAASHCNTLEAGLLTTTPIGMFPEGATPQGICDMAGNVEEYVADDYAPYPGGPRIFDDLMRDRHGYRVARGGSFTRFRDLARNQRRHGRFPHRIYVMGFRLALHGV